MKYLNWFFLITLTWTFCGCNNVSAQSGKGKRPNFIIIFTDDQGYQDLSCFGSPNINTPNIDKLAKEGIQATDFYVAASVCSASRAALLTGKYPVNNGVGGVFFPDAKGMKAEEVTIAEMLKNVGYQTACFGKWHLGDLDGHLPTDQGFDHYFGIPYSNDMYIGSNMQFADDVVFRDGYCVEKAKEDQAFCAEHKTKRSKIKEKGIKELVPLMENKKVVEYPCNQSTLTQRYFQKAIDMVNNSDEQPFFIYLTPAMPHVPLFASDKFAGKSKAGLYGDVLEEIDFYVGKLKRALKDKGIDDHTAIIFASDNGPWLGYKDKAGKAHPLRDGKFSNYEGGVRVPGVFHWPGVWEKGVKSQEILSTIDLMPTLAYYANVKDLKTVDGLNLASYLENTENICPRQQFIYTRNTSIHGIRKGDWKLLTYSGKRNSDKNSPPELFNLKNDISEQQNVYAEYPEIVKELSKEIEKYRKQNAK